MADFINDIGSDQTLAGMKFDRLFLRVQRSRKKSAMLWAWMRDGPVHSTKDFRPD